MARMTIAQANEQLRAENQELRTMLDKANSKLEGYQEKVEQLLDKLTSGELITKGSVQASQPTPSNRPTPIGGRHQPTDQTPQRKAELATLYNNIRAVVDHDGGQVYNRAFTDTLHNHLRSLVYQNLSTLPLELRNQLMEQPQCAAWLAHYDTEIAARFGQLAEATA
jgi:hypothetical protein